MNGIDKNEYDWGMPRRPARTSERDFSGHRAKLPGPSKVETIKMGITHDPPDRKLVPSDLIVRAMRLAGDRRAFDPADVQKALVEALTERGWLVPDEDALGE